MRRYLWAGDDGVTQTAAVRAADSRACMGHRRCWLHTHQPSPCKIHTVCIWCALQGGVSRMYRLCTVQAGRLRAIFSGRMSSSPSVLDPGTDSSRTCYLGVFTTLPPATAGSLDYHSETISVCCESHEQSMNPPTTTTHTSGPMFRFSLCIDRAH